MNHWEKLLQDIPIPQVIEQIRNLLATSVIPHPDAKNDVDRIALVLSYIEEKLGQSVQELVSKSQITELYNLMNASYNELVHYFQNQNRAHLDAATTNIDGVLRTIASLPYPASENDGSFNAIISLYRTKMEQTVKAANEQVKAAMEEVDQLKTQLRDITKEVGTVQQNLTSQQEAIVNITNLQQEQFTTAQEERRKEAAQEMKDLTTKVQILLDDAKEKNKITADELKKSASEEFAAYTKAAETSLDAIKDKEAQATKLLESVGIKSQTYQYAGVSKQERDAAMWLRLGAILLMLSVVAVVMAPAFIHLVAILKAAPETVVPAFDWKNVLYRIPASLIIFAPAYYMATESTKHRKTEVENKRIELELAALNPYMELFTEEKKTEIKEGLVGKYFVGHSRNEGNVEASKSAWLADVLPNIVEKVVDKVMERVPSFKNE